MEYVIAVIGLSAACIVWYLVQRLTGHYDGSADPDAALRANDKSFGCGPCASCGTPDSDSCASRTAD
jgi:hypothetical protein